ncbi:uncharacterized protein Pyn_26656 [Prunus yedoensis var. nudiflora]|uniref:Uncharacterized protein n=1 Tax=Prunus yedoensis var. nudiflora TaxID=2094558 RepID=A0A314XJE4_PRUYE|nr:uncharacterized protein Pyn_26656 [Prunus yedoensis var. nudiflora]
MEASSPSASSRKRKTRQAPMPQIVLALAAPNSNPANNNAIERTVWSTKPRSNCSGRRRKQKAAAAQQEHERQLQIPTTERTVSSTKIQSNYSLRTTARGGRKTAPQEQEHEEKKGRLKVVRIRILDPYETESSTDTGETNVAVNKQPKKKKVEIVHEIRMLERNPPCPKKLETQETSKKKESKKNYIGKNNKQICLSSRSSSPSCNVEGREDEEILKGSSTTSSVVQMAVRKMALYDVPGPIPDLDEFLKWDYDLHFLLTFFDDMPSDSDCEDY